MDFGLARSDEVGLTMTGLVLASVDYSSPEQVQAQPTDERSDLYSVGVSLYQMVTGKRMFSVTSSFSIMQAQVQEIPRPPIEIVPAIPKALSDAIMIAVSKSPAQRFQSADAFRSALSHVTSGAAAAPATEVPAQTRPEFDPGFTVPTQSNSQNTRNLLLVAAVLVTAALVVGAAMYKSLHRPEADQAAGAPVEDTVAHQIADGANPKPAAKATKPATKAAAKTGAATTKPK